jgi:hypothetical protein
MSIVDLASVEKNREPSKSRLLWRPGITDGEAGIYYSNSECHWEQLFSFNVFGFGTLLLLEI